jgi:CO/xanthine dehydrogenase FAD-binding subunit
MEALQLRQARGGRFLAGGTDVFPALVDSGPPADFIDLTACADLKGIEVAATHVRIGGGVTWAEIARADLPVGFRGLQAAAREVGSAQIQNRATIGGNLCNASPAADGAPPLLALDAEVELVGLRGRRILSIGEFLLGNRRTAREPDEILAAVRVPHTMGQARSAFRKLGSRKYLVISIVMVGVSLVVVDDEIAVARVAVGAASAAARRLLPIERRLVGRNAGALSHRDFLTADDFVDLTPIDDIRATADYRLDAAQELVARAVLDAWEAAHA